MEEERESVGKNVKGVGSVGRCEMNVGKCVETCQVRLGGVGESSWVSVGRGIR